MDKAPLHCAYDNKWKGDPTDEIISQRDADHDHYTAKIREIFVRIDALSFKNYWGLTLLNLESKEWQQLKEEMGVD